MGNKTREKGEYGYKALSRVCFYILKPGERENKSRLSYEKCGEKKV